MLEGVKKAVKNRYPKFLERGVVKFLLIDAHMNNLTPSTDLSAVTDDKVIKLLDKLMEETNFTSLSSDAVITSMIKGATYARVSHQAATMFEQHIVDAILASFINYCGTSAGVDVSLRAVDLSKS